MCIPHPMHLSSISEELRSVRKKHLKKDTASKIKSLVEEVWSCLVCFSFTHLLLVIFCFLDSSSRKKKSFLFLRGGYTLSNNKCNLCNICIFFSSTGFGTLVLQFQTLN